MGAGKNSACGSEQSSSMEKETIRAELTRLSDKKYREFARKLLPKSENLIGVRLPLLRRLAKKIAEDISELPPPDSFEETMLRGMALCYADIGVKERLKLISEFMPLIKNWSVCDSVCATIKIKEDESGEYFKYVKNKIRSKAEYECRFAYVMFLNFFTERKFIEFAFKSFERFDNEFYYAKTACAWCVASFHAKFPRETSEFVLSGEMKDQQTLSIAVRKIIESRKTSPELAKKLREFKCRPSPAT